MDEALRFFRLYEGWIYFFIALGAVLYLRRLFVNFREMRSTIFGLERTSAQTRFNQAVTVLVLLILIGIGEFVIVSYIAPLRPESIPLLTPTIDLLATATATLPAESTPDGTGPAEDGATPVPTPTIDARIGQCVAGVLEITFPEPADQLLGEVEITGSANVDNFGFYKLEVTPQSQATWRTIQAGRIPVQDGVLVTNWDTSTLAPGDYLLRLVVTDANGFLLPDCQVPITILLPQEG
jgi:hypothetical protein